MKDVRDALEKESTDEGATSLVERPQTQRMGSFYLLYEAKRGADFNIFNVDAAAELAKVEALATARDDFKDFCLRHDNRLYPACKTLDTSPLRFLYASQFNVDAAKAVVDELKKPEVMKAHKIMGPITSTWPRRKPCGRPWTSETSPPCSAVAPVTLRTPLLMLRRRLRSRCRRRSWPSP